VTLKPKTRSQVPGRARLCGKRHGKVNQRDQPIGMLLPAKLP
jgi:hypothetical protein